MNTCKHCNVTFNPARWNCLICKRRLAGDVWSGALPCFADAERSANKAGGGDPQSLAVSPGKAKAELISEWLLHAEENCRLLCKRFVFGKRRMELASGIEDTIRCARELLQLIAEPDSEAPKERSGRRTLMWSHR